MKSPVVLRLQQLLIVLVAALLATGMVLLGRWQLDVYHQQGARASAQRAAQAPVPLTSVGAAGTAITDGFGRTVSFTGTYDPTLQVLIPQPDDAGTSRVLTALRQSDGSLVPVVRGVVSTSTAPAPPSETVTETGVLLPSEDAAGPGGGPTQLGSVRVPVLAQQWSGPLVDGFVTLAPGDAQAQGLTPAALVLPDAPGRFRNGAYAIQWWLFAAFALLMAVRTARDLGRQGLEPVPEITAGSSPDPT